jgi:hypothetical protein
MQWNVTVVSGSLTIKKGDLNMTTEYICLWKAMLQENRLKTMYRGRCDACDGHDLLCSVYTPNDECSALEGYNPSRNTPEDLVLKLLKGER